MTAIYKHRNGKYYSEDMRCSRSLTTIIRGGGDRSMFDESELENMDRIRGYKKTVVVFKDQDLRQYGYYFDRSFMKVHDALNRGEMVVMFKEVDNRRSYIAVMQDESGALVSKVLKERPAKRHFTVKNEVVIDFDGFQRTSNKSVFQGVAGILHTTIRYYPVGRKKATIATKIADLENKIATLQRRLDELKGK